MGRALKTTNISYLKNIERSIDNTNRSSVKTNNNLASEEGAASNN